MGHAEHLALGAELKVALAWLDAGDTPTLVATIDGNGYAGPVTMYLYWQNRVTHERRYISSSGAIEDRGVVVDLFGSAGGPLALWAPSFTDLELLGIGEDLADRAVSDRAARGAAPRPDCLPRD